MTGCGMDQMGAHSQVGSSVLQERRSLACEHVEEQLGKSKERINSSHTEQSTDRTSSSQLLGPFSYYPTGVFEETGSLVIPRPITNFARRREEASEMETDARFSQFPSMAWKNKGRDSASDLLTKNLRAPGTPPTPTPVPKEEYDFADFDGAVEENSKVVNNDLQNNASVLAISRGNLEHIYLCQETVYRFMNLANMIRSNGAHLGFQFVSDHVTFIQIYSVSGDCLRPGWNLCNSGIDILRGSVVLVSRAEQWKLRRIKSWCIDTMSITLEDGTLVWPLDLYNQLLIDDELHVKYALEEYTHQVQVNRLERFSAEEILCTFHTLAVCSDVLRRLSESTQEYPAISELVTMLHEDPLTKYLPSFITKLHSANIKAEQKISEEHEQLIRHRDPRLKNHFSVWMGVKCTSEKREAYLRQSYCQSHLSDSFLRIHAGLIKQLGLDTKYRLCAGEWQKISPFFDDISPGARIAAGAEREHESIISFLPGSTDGYPSAVFDKKEGRNCLTVEHYAGYIPAMRNSTDHCVQIDEAQDTNTCVPRRLSFLPEEVRTPGLVRLVCPIGVSRIKQKAGKQQAADEFTFFEGDLPKPVLVDDDSRQEVVVFEPIPAVAQLDKKQTIVNQPLDALLGAVVQETSCKVLEKEPIKKISRKRKSTQAPTIEKIRRK